MGDKYRTEQRDKLRGNEGFTDSEVRNLKTSFEQHDADASGSIANKELPKLLDALFPGVRQNLETHARAKAVLEKSDQDGDGAVTFEEFLIMMRQVQDETAREALANEQKIIQDCGYTRDEVKEFRKVFGMYDSDNSGDITLKELKLMFRKLIPLGAHQLNQLTRIFKEVDTDGSKTMGFTEFLVIMKRVMDMDLGGINQKTKDLSESEPQSPQSPG